MSYIHSLQFEPLVLGFIGPTDSSVLEHRVMDLGFRLWLQFHVHLFLFPPLFPPAAPGSFGLFLTPNSALSHHQLYAIDDSCATEESQKLFTDYHLSAKLITNGVSHHLS